ncbi:hypothetical protein [Herbidospora mongoliensis]|uniref:hypothetical protein n=1 Tax=Herbidospora mongoliensis TaxID=688067 RepID=UPI0012FA408E|nr:hypothetical protein [Herbidospora mongoliensis]
MSRTIHHVPPKHRKHESSHGIFTLRYSAAALRSNSAPSRVYRTVVVRLFGRHDNSGFIANWAAQSHRRRRAADRVTARTALQFLRADVEADIEFGDPRHRRDGLWLA